MTATIKLAEKEIALAQKAIAAIGLNWTMEQFIHHCLQVGFDHEISIYEEED